MKKEYVEYLEMSDTAIKLAKKFKDDNMKGDLEKGQFERNIAKYKNRKQSFEQVKKEYKSKHKLDESMRVDGNLVGVFSKPNYKNILLYIHGGAYVFEIDEVHYRFCDEMVDKLNAKVYMPLYPLAPEATYKDAHKMMEKLYDIILKEKKPIFIMGDSAGGGFTAALIQTIKKSKKKMPKKIVLFSPWVDMTMSNPDCIGTEKDDVTLAVYGTKQAAKLWSNNTNLHNYRLSPIYGDLDRYPDILIYAGTHEIIFSDIIRYFVKLSNTNVKMVAAKGYWHVFPLYPIKERVPCIKEIVRFCNN